MWGSKIRSTVHRDPEITGLLSVGYSTIGSPVFDQVESETVHWSVFVLEFGGGVLLTPGRTARHLPRRQTRERRKSLLFSFTHSSPPCSCLWSSLISCDSGQVDTSSTLPVSKQGKPNTIASILPQTRHSLCHFPFTDPRHNLDLLRRLNPPTSKGSSRPLHLGGTG